MTTDKTMLARLAVAAVLLVFAWKGATVDIPWPPATPDAPAGPVTPLVPDPALLGWAANLKPILPTMLPADRTYLSQFYDAMSFVLLRDGKLDQPIITTTDKFAAFHANSLRLSIDRAKVGQYPGLDKAIDATFFAANGAEVKPVTADSRAKLIAACQVLSWTLGIRGDE